MRRQDKLTRKQMGVLYATHKAGKLRISKDQMELLYDMNEGSTENSNETRIAMLEVVDCIKHDDFKSANDVVLGILESVEDKPSGTNPARNRIKVERVNATNMTRGDMARSLGLITDVGGFERAWGFPDHSSYSGDPYLDEIGMDIHDLGF